MLHKEFWGLVFLAFVAWIFVASNPTERIQHTCRPIAWTGNVVTSLSALVLPDQQKKVDDWFGKLEYGCQYMTWRLFYQEQYNAWLAQQKAAQTAVSTQATNATAASAEAASKPANAAPPSAPTTAQPATAK